MSMPFLIEGQEARAFAHTHLLGSRDQDLQCKQRTSGRIPREEREHVRIEDVNSVEDLKARAAVLLERVLHVRHGDGNAERRELVLRGADLRDEVRGRQDAVEERLGAELDRAGDELGLGVRVQRREERIAALLPLRATIEAELRTRIRGGRER